MVASKVTRITCVLRWRRVLLSLGEPSPLARTGVDESQISLAWQLRSHGTAPSVAPTTTQYSHWHSLDGEEYRAPAQRTVCTRKKSVTSACQCYTTR